MKKETREVKQKIESITKVSDFEDLLEQTMLSDEEKQILRMRYKDQKSFGYIADILGMSERNAHKKHSKALMKIGKMF